MKRLISLAALLVLSVAAPTAAQDKPKEVCLEIGQVYDFKPVPGNRTLIVTDRLRKKFKLTFLGICNDLQFNLGLGFKSFGAGQLSCLSRGDYVIARNPANPGQRCPIDKIEAYTPEMEKADLAAAAAKAH